MHGRRGRATQFSAEAPDRVADVDRAVVEAAVVQQLELGPYAPRQRRLHPPGQCR